MSPAEYEAKRPLVEPQVMKDLAETTHQELVYTQVLRATPMEDTERAAINESIRLLIERYTALCRIADDWGIQAPNARN